MKLYVVRHGEVPSNVENIISGCNDEELTERGIVQATEIKNKLANIKFDVIYSSPVKRARQTAEIIVPTADIIIDSRIAERDPGKLLGKSRNIIDKNTWNSLTLDQTLEGAETLKTGLKRVQSFLDDLHKNNKDKTILIITHNFISKCLWIIENNIKNEEQIKSFFHANDEVKYYED